LWTLTQGSPLRGQPWAEGCNPFGILEWCSSFTPNLRQLGLQLLFHPRDQRPIRLDQRPLRLQLGDQRALDGQCR